MAICGAQMGSDPGTEKGDNWKGYDNCEGQLFSQQEMSVAIKKMKENIAEDECGMIVNT